jgi:hypothetical protein
MIDPLFHGWDQRDLPISREIGSTTELQFSAEESIWLQSGSATAVARGTPNSSAASTTNQESFPHSNVEGNQRRSIVARLRDNTTLVGISFAIITPQVGRVAEPRVVHCAESNATSLGYLDEGFWAPTAVTSLQQQKPKIAKDVLPFLRHLATNEGDKGSGQARLEEFLEQFLGSYGAAGLDVLEEDIRQASPSDYDRTAVVLNSLLSIVGTAGPRENVIDLLIALLGSPSPALRYEAAIGLTELKAVRAIPALESAAATETSRQLRSFLADARNALQA